MNSKKDFPGGLKRGLKRVTPKDCKLCDELRCCAIGNLWYAFPTIDSVIWGEGKGCPQDWKIEETQDLAIEVDNSRPTINTPTL